jgi:hypothetical protein
VLLTEPRRPELQIGQTTAPVVLLAEPTQSVSTTASSISSSISPTPTSESTNSTATLRVIRTTTQSSIVYAVFETTVLEPDPSSETAQQSTSTTSFLTTATVSSASSRPTCPSPRACNASDCAGQNQIGQLGWCTEGPSAGCGCVSICGPDMGSCDAIGCDGQLGYCESGDWRGCPCSSG